MNKQPLRIVLFTSLYAPFLSGVSTAVHQRVRWLLQQGHEVFLIHPGINNKYPKKVLNCAMQGLDELQAFPNFSSYAFPTNPLIFYKSLPQPLHYRNWSDTKLLEKFQPDIVVVEEAPQLRGFYSIFLQGYGRPVGTDYSRRTGTPTISIFHTDIVAYIRYYLGDNIFRLVRHFIPLLIKQFSQAYDVNYFPSRELLAKYNGMKSQRGEYLPYQGVNCEKFHPQNITYNPIPDDHRPTVLFVGRITPEKNVTQVIDAFPLIAAKIPDVHLVMVGSGPQDEEIRRRVRPFASNITIWGESHGTELLGLYARADVFVNPSVTENFCTTNMEALASGTPVVAADAGGNPEQVLHGISGFLSIPNNPTDLAEKVITILENPLIKEEMSQQARPSILKFDWPTCMQHFEEKLYERVQGIKVD
jgi:glycosyltransferase involved in cell wall biosynthesis